MNLSKKYSMEYLLVFETAKRGTQTLSIKKPCKSAEFIFLKHCNYINIFKLAEFVRFGEDQSVIFCKI